MLLLLRETLKPSNVLREVADSIAHQTRDKGLLHDSINTAYFQMKPMLERMMTDAQGGATTASTDIGRVKLLVYQALKNLVGRTDGDLYVRKLGMSKNQCLEMMDQSYRRSGDGQEMYLYLTQNGNSILRLLEIASEQLKLAPVMNGMRLAATLNDTLKSAKVEYSIPSSCDKNFSKWRDDVSLCFLALLAGCEYKLFDGTTSRLTLCTLSSTSEQDPFIGLSAILRVGNMLHAYVVVDSTLRLRNFLELNGTLDARDMFRHNGGGECNRDERSNLILKTFPFDSTPPTGGTFFFHNTTFGFMPPDAARSE